MYLLSNKLKVGFEGEGQGQSKLSFEGDEGGGELPAQALGLIVH